jgi:ribonuclease HI
MNEVHSNNVAEYEALVNGLRITIELGIQRMEIRGGSRIVMDRHETVELPEPQDGDLLSGGAEPQG